MPRFAANLSLMFTEVPFLDRFEAAAGAGFKGVEFLFPYAFDIDDIRARLDAHGLQVVLFNLPPGHWDEGERGITALTGREDEFAAGVDLALRYADALGCPRVHAMAGLEPHGTDRDVYVRNLTLAAEWARGEGVDVLIEPINTFDMQGYFLTTTEQARDVISAVGAANLGLQFDLYHRERMQGGVMAAISEFQPITRHYQCANPPDRSEPASDVIDYAAVFRAIDATGFDGWIGCEYRPKAATVAGLGWLAACGVTLG
ncbi:MAG: hydroxypyruvate isomerase [Hyphomicrobium sp. 32-62-53]|nr:MAG: hydroxypyruvate isomerase [Hyphomicrobium sp. 12-62-95]OYY00031.1 MAG: hydroxypyruvate isomerase [Hyphomicrobium sp. 32-62-53]